MLNRVNPPRHKAAFTLLSVVAQVSLLFSMTGIGVLFTPSAALAVAKSNPTIWMTRDACGPKNTEVGSFDAGDRVFINGKNFTKGLRDWDIIGNAGTDSINSIADGRYKVDSDGKFCFKAYTIKKDDQGDYNMSFASKHASYQVDKATSIDVKGIALVNSVAADSNVTPIPVSASISTPAVVRPRVSSTHPHVSLPYSCTDISIPPEVIGNDLTDLLDLSLFSSHYSKNGVCKDVNPLFRAWADFDGDGCTDDVDKEILSKYFRIAEPNVSNFYCQQNQKIGLRECPDIDRSGRVDIVDLSILGDAYGHNANEKAYNSEADFDQDGVVGDIDKAIFAKAFTNPDWVSPYCTYKTGSIIVDKKVDINGDGTFDGSNKEANQLGFRWGIDGVKPDREMGKTADDVIVGSHLIDEHIEDGYHFVGWYSTVNTLPTPFDCAHPQGKKLPIEVNVAEGGTTGITLCNARDTGSIKVTKVVEGPATPDQFGFRLGDSGSYSYPAAGQDSVTFNGLPTGQYVVSETDGPGGTDYTARFSEECLNGIITVMKDAEVACTITNTRDTGTIDFLKVVDNEPEADLSRFNFNVDGNPYRSGDSHTFPTGSYILTEDLVADYSFVSASGACSVNPDNGSIVLDVTTEGGTCVVTNMHHSGDLRVNKEVDTDGDGIYDLKDNESANALGFRWGYDSNPVDRLMGSVESSVPTGPHGITENIVPGYHFTGWYRTFERFAKKTDLNALLIDGETHSCSDPEGLSFPTLNVLTDQTTSVTLCNARDTGNIEVRKNVVASDGTTDVIDSHSFQVTLDGGDQREISETISTTYAVATGSYKIAELTDPDYELVSMSGNGLVDVTSGQTAVVEIVNKQKPAAADKTVSPNLNITKTASVSTVDQGKTLSYTVVVSNTGNSVATSASLSDTLPAGLAFVDGGGTTMNIALGDIAPGASIAKTYDVLVLETAAAGDYDNIARAQATNHGPVTATATVEVKTTAKPSGETAPDLNITKQVDRSTANSGDTLTYKVKVKNTGTDTAKDVVVVDTLPDGLTFLTAGGNEHTWNLGDMKAGKSKTLTYKVRVGKNVATGEYVNTAIASAQDIDPIKAKRGVDIKSGQVLGAETTLPETGAGPWDYGIISGAAIILLAGISLLRYRRNQFSPTKY